MGIIEAERLNQVSRIRIDIPDLANYAIAASFIDSEDTTKIYHLNDDGYVLLPANRGEFHVLCTAVPVTDDSVPPPTAKVWIEQDGEPLALFNRANPTTVSALGREGQRSISNELYAILAIRRVNDGGSAMVLYKHATQIIGGFSFVLSSAYAQERDIRLIEIEPTSIQSRQDERTIFGTFGDADAFKIDTSLPSYPALALLSQDESAITNVATPEDFGTQLINQFAEDGSLKVGFAFGGSPYWWFRKSSLTLEEYAGFTDDNGRRSDGCAGGDVKCLSKFQRVLARTTVSIGAVQLDESGTMSGGDGYKAAAGASTELLDRADPRFNTELRACVRRSYRDLIDRNGREASQLAKLAVRSAYERLKQLGEFSDLPIVIPREDLTDYTAVNAANRDVLRINPSARAKFDELESEERSRVNIFTEILDEQFINSSSACRDQASEVLQRQQSLRIGLAVAARSESGDFSDLDYDGASLWASYRRPFGDGSGALSSFGLFATAEFDQTEVKTVDDMMTDAVAGTSPTESREFDGVKVGLNVNRVRNDFVITGALSYVTRDFDLDTVEDEDFLLATVTATYKIRDGLWIEGSFGWADDEAKSANEFAGIRVKADWGRLGVGG